MGRISTEEKRKNLVISFAQFRPEKRHALQLRIWKQVIE
jgi:alpha-1,2-mannosyltransferase